MLLDTAAGSNSTGARHVRLWGSDLLSSSSTHQDSCKNLQNAQVCICMCVYTALCVCIQIPELFLHFKILTSDSRSLKKQARGFF